MSVPTVCTEHHSLHPQESADVAVRVHDPRIFVSGGMQKCRPVVTKSSLVVGNGIHT